MRLRTAMGTRLGRWRALGESRQPAGGEVTRVWPRALLVVVLVAGGLAIALEQHSYEFDRMLGRVP